MQGWTTLLYPGPHWRF